MIARIQTLSSTLDVSPLTLLRSISSILPPFIRCLRAAPFPAIFTASFLSLTLVPLVFSLLPSVSLNAPLFPSAIQPLVSIRSLLPRSYLDLPLSRTSPFSCIYIYLYSSDPWIKLHPRGRTTLVDELAIGRMRCASPQLQQYRHSCPVDRQYAFVITVSFYIISL